MISAQGLKLRLKSGLGLRHQSQQPRDGWLATLKANGLEKAATFGQYLGNRYKDFPNIIWMYGNE